MFSTSSVLRLRIGVRGITNSPIVDVIMTTECCQQSLCIQQCFHEWHVPGLIIRMLHPPLRSYRFKIKTWLSAMVNTLVLKRKCRVQWDVKECEWRNVCFILLSQIWLCSREPVYHLSESWLSGGITLAMNGNLTDWSTQSGRICVLEGVCPNQYPPLLSKNQRIRIGIFCGPDAAYTGR